VAAFAVALGVMLAVPTTGYYPLLLLLLTDPVVHAVRRARGSGSAPSRVGG
jgi:hypothetical protein